MRAMILAAGQGVRMRPLTIKTPKPLLRVKGKPLIQYHVESLVRAGVHEIVINHAVMGEQIEAFLGDGHTLGAEIHYSAEGNTPLETGGGIFRALHLLGEQPFIALNADIWTDYPLQNLPQRLTTLAHLVLVGNPRHNLQGDFSLCGDNQVINQGTPRYTFSGIGVYQPELFSDCRPGAFPLAPLLQKAVDENRVTGELYTGVWSDIGTPERLRAVQDINK